MKKLIAITIGDINGIGIKILINEWKNNNISNFILISNNIIFNNLKLIKKNKVNSIDNYKDLYKYDKNKLNLLNYSTENKYTNTYDSLKIAYELTKNKLFIGILTLPLNKKLINKYVDKKFIDQTTFFSKLEKKESNNMIFIFNNKFFVPLTIHIEIKNVYKYFKDKNYIKNKIISLNKTLKDDFKIKKPNLILTGINPHSGEKGLISKDDEKFIDPLLKDLKKLKINITGPVSADSVINKNNLLKYNAFLFAYHDQALIPFKIISNLEGINYTSNLNIIRLSPSHGTANDIKNVKKANPNSILKCFKLIKKIDKNRNKID